MVLEYHQCRSLLSRSSRSLVVVWHSRTGLAEQMARCLRTGAEKVAAANASDEDTVSHTSIAAEPPPSSFSTTTSSTSTTGPLLRVRSLRAADARPADLLKADGLLFCAPENLASLSGEMKEFFDRMYYEMLVEEGSSGESEARSPGGDKSNKKDVTTRYLLAGRPFGLAVAAGSDGTSAARQMARICQGWRLKSVREGEHAGALIVRNGLVQTKRNILEGGKGRLLSERDREKLEELGGLVAAHVML